MISEFPAMPDEFRKLMSGRYLGLCQETTPPNSTDRAKEHARGSFSYALRMFWQTRFTKIDAESVELFDWISVNLLPEDVGYLGVKQGQILIDHPNHGELADRVFEVLWDHCQARPDSTLEGAVTRTLTDRMRGLFRR